ncbi:AraC family transcriptional regulator [Flammeovirga agarivorans]|uniref:Helix-turn-helix domain-containing protein n=1 Tax=Flammeovirga agarivorans TaxID=2726742 RepID=A0A7X8SPE9_9BACT|nr:helix-turn-helix domain-containing protein [Flammeovirga agarivorans]NLR93959.1 helix-turn-helix domain-containing protein [Flammeovirga agarivorans]
MAHNYERTRILDELNLDYDDENLCILLDYLHIYRFDSEEKFRLHAHPNFEFHYIASGKGTIGILDPKFLNSEHVLEMKGLSNSANVDSLLEYYLKKNKEKELEDLCTIYHVEKGDVFVNPAGQFHFQIADKDDPIVEYSFRCTYEPKKLDADIHTINQDLKKVMELITQSTGKVYKDHHNVGKLFESILEEASFRMPGYIVNVKGLLQQIIVAFSRHMWDKKSMEYNFPEMELTNKRNKIIDTYIVDNLEKNITSQELAEVVFMSQRSLFRFFKKEKGVSVHQYILQFKVNRALKLLEHSQISLAEIADLTGFSSQFHLSRVIKKHTGQSPSEYRTLNHQLEPSTTE